VVAPEDAVYVPIALAVYDSDGRLIGEIFEASPGLSVAVGPSPGEYTVVSGYADEGFTLTGKCSDSRRRVVEDYDFTVEAGWHDIIQSFEEDPGRERWRIDAWRNDPVPEDAVWVLLRP
jgi:hypothetical protein